MAIKQQIKTITHNNKQLENKLKEEAQQVKRHRRQQLNKEAENRKKGEGFNNNHGN